jgi:hypothetical protein
MSKLPTIMPMLARLHREPFDGSEWVFEVKHDGFRAIAFIEGGQCRLLSRNGYRFSEFHKAFSSLRTSAQIFVYHFYDALAAQILSVRALLPIITDLHWPYIGLHDLMSIT